MISRKLAHKVNGRLQLIVSLIETEEPKKAVKEIQSLAHLLNDHIEDQDEERLREKREERL